MSENTNFEIRALSADEIDAVGGGDIAVDGAHAINVFVQAVGIVVGTLLKGLAMGLRPECH